MAPFPNIVAGVQIAEGRLPSLEICAGAGGQALGLEDAGFQHVAAVELDHDAYQTLARNRPEWHPLEENVRNLDGRKYKGIALLAGGVPCPPFSIAGRRLGSDDERDLFPTALKLVEEAEPLAVLLENVPGIATARFADYRAQILRKLDLMDYAADWPVLQASDFGVPQLRPRAVLVAIKKKYAPAFRWPTHRTRAGTVGHVLQDLMAAGGWPGASSWVSRANQIAPTLVGGSKKHGGPDLGPTRAKQAWRLLGVDGMGIADAPPGRDFPFDGLPKLTVRMTARLQGFPDSWAFSGRKTASYRQVGNAFPPPVAKAVGAAIRHALEGTVEDAPVPLESIVYQVAD